MTYPGPATYPGSSTFPSVAQATSGGGTGGSGSSGGSGPVSPSAPGPFASAGGELTATFVYSQGVPHVGLYVNWPGATQVTITRSDATGQFPVRSAESVTLDASGTNATNPLNDFEPAYGTYLTYTITSPQKTTIPTVRCVPFQPPRPWRSALIHPQAPGISVPIRLHEGTTATFTRAARQVALKVLGRPNPVVVTDVRDGRSSQLVVLCESRDEVAALEGLLADGSAVRFASDATLQWGLDQCWMAIGDMSVARAVSSLPSNLDYIVTLPYTEVDRPLGAFVGTGSSGGGTGTGTGSGFWTYASAQAAYPTYAAAQAAFKTYANAALDKVG